MFCSMMRHINHTFNNQSINVDKLQDTTTYNPKSSSGMIAGAHTASQWPKPAYQAASIRIARIALRTSNGVTNSRSSGPGGRWVLHA